MRREQGRVPGCHPISSSSSSQYNGLSKLIMKPKFLVPNFDMIEQRKYIIVASQGRLSVHCVAGLGELQLFWSHRIPKSFKNPHNTSEKNVTKKLPMNISNLLAIL